MLFSKNFHMSLALSLSVMSQHAWTQDFGAESGSRGGAHGVSYDTHDPLGGAGSAAELGKGVAGGGGGGGGVHHTDAEGGLGGSGGSGAHGRGGGKGGTSGVTAYIGNAMPVNNLQGSTGSNGVRGGNNESDFATGDAGSGGGGGGGGSGAIVYAPSNGQVKIGAIDIFAGNGGGGGHAGDIYYSSIEDYGGSGGGGGGGGGGGVGLAVLSAAHTELTGTVIAGGRGGNGGYGSANPSGRTPTEEIIGYPGNAASGGVGLFVGMGDLTLNNVVVRGGDGGEGAGIFYQQESNSYHGNPYRIPSGPGKSWSGSAGDPPPEPSSPPPPPILEPSIGGGVGEEPYIDPFVLDPEFPGEDGIVIGRQQKNTVQPINQQTNPLSLISTAPSYPSGTAGASGGDAVMMAQDSANLTMFTSLKAIGGSGGDGGYGFSVSWMRDTPYKGGVGGQGGNGGSGIRLSGQNTGVRIKPSQNDNKVLIVGGNGGNGGAGGYSNTTIGGAGGDSGDGAAAIAITGLNGIVELDGSVAPIVVKGGYGGYAGQGAVTQDPSPYPTGSHQNPKNIPGGKGGQGGQGGTGIELAQGGTLILTGDVTIEGGRGGHGGIGADGGNCCGNNISGGQGGTGGRGGAAIVAEVGGALSIGAGVVVRAGMGGQAGRGGVGGTLPNQPGQGASGNPGQEGLSQSAIITNGQTVITIGGTISSLDLNVPAIVLNQGNNRLELWQGFQIKGKALATANDLTKPDTFALGGSQHGTFSVSTLADQYRGFNRFEKSGISTWVLVNGGGAVHQNWVVTNGILQGNSSTIQANVFLSSNGFTMPSLLFDQSMNGTYSGQLSGTGPFVKKGSGILTMNGLSQGLNDDGSGSPEPGVVSTISSGHLHIGDAKHPNAILGGHLNVGTTATLGGHGKVVGNVNVAANAHLAPGGIDSNADSHIGTLSIGGNLTLDPNSQLDYEFGRSSGNFSRLGTGDSTHVTGTLGLHGAMLNVSTPATFERGLYNIFTYGQRSASDGDLQLTCADCALQYLSQDQKINLINGLDLNIWNGNGAATPTHLGGGDGIWTATSSNWTDWTGQIPGALSPPGYAVVGGVPGTMTLDDSAGALSVYSMQFAVDGYRLTGAPLTLSAGSVTAAMPPVIRVGDGSRNGANYSVEIDTVVQGNEGVRIIDAGKVILTKVNTYTGDTTISDATLSISQDANLGHSSNSVIIDGGTLEVTQTMSTPRTITLTDRGGALRTVSLTTFTPGPIVDAPVQIGRLVINGSGEVSMVNAHTYTGGTEIIEGAHTKVSAAGNLGTGPVLIDGSNSVVGSFPKLTFESGSSATNLAITNQHGGQLLFDSASAATAVITNNTDGRVIFKGASSADTATISNNAAVDISQLSTPGINIGSLSGRGNVDLGSKVLTVGGLNQHDIITGVISDVGLGGSLIKVGSNKLTLTGANSYSAGTVVQSGTLEGNTQSLQGEITNHANLIFNQAIDGNFQGYLKGNGKLEKAGPAQLSLNADNSDFSGSTTISHGILTVGDASHPNAVLGGDIVVQSNATLKGHGTILGTVLNQGAVRPGGSIGILTIQGNYSQQAGSTLMVDVLPIGESSQLQIEGTAQIEDNTGVEVIAQNGDWQPFTQYRILTANKGLTGRFTTVNTNLAFLAPALDYTENTVFLSLWLNNIGFIDITKTPNQRAVAYVANKLGLDNPIYEAILGLEVDVARNAFDQLSADIYPSGQKVMLDQSQYVQEGVHAHLQDKNDNEPHHQDVWINAWGHWGRTRTDGNAATMSASGSGVLIGSDLIIDKENRAGVLLGYVDDRLKLANRNGAHAKGDSLAVGVYGRTKRYPVALEASVLYGHHDMEVHRDIAFGRFQDTVKGHLKGKSFTTHVEGSYPMRVNEGIEVAPFAGFSYAHLRTGPVQEQGALAALDIAGETRHKPEALVGVRGQWHQEKLNAYMSLAWRHNLLDDTRTRHKMRFASGSRGFIIRGLPLTQNRSIFSMGVQWRLAKDVTLDASYIGQFTEKMVDQTAQARVEWRF